MLIYLVTNKVNGKCYVGMTKKSLRHRRRDHINHAKNGSSFVFRCALRKYGAENFEFSELDVADSWEALKRKEIMWIEFFNSKVPNGYNMTEGGEGTLGFPAPNKGKTPSKETREKIAAAHRGMKASDAARQKMSEVRKGKPCPWMRGKKLSRAHFRKLQAAAHTPSWRRKRSESMKRAWARGAFDNR